MEDERPLVGAVCKISAGELKSLGTELPNEIKRVRDEVLSCYLEIGPSGAFAVAMMRHTLDVASKAMIEGDVVEMMHAYRELKNYST